MIHQVVLKGIDRFTFMDTIAGAETSGNGRQLIELLAWMETDAQGAPDPAWKLDSFIISGFPLSRNDELSTFQISVACMKTGIDVISRLDKEGRLRVIQAKRCYTVVDTFAEVLRRAE